MAQAGCIELSVSFDFTEILSFLSLNSIGNGVGIWNTHTMQSNYWDALNTTTGVFNFFDDYTQGPIPIIQLYNGPILEDTVKHISVGVNNYTYQLYYFDSGVLIELNPLETQVLPPRTYLLRITSTLNTATSGNPCIYNYSFMINGFSTFIPVNLSNDTWANKWGCTDATALNYYSAYNANNNGCDYDISDDINGCTDINACNYLLNANIDDGSCDFSCYGCTDNNATNFKSSATIPCNGTYSFCLNINQPNCCCVYGENESWGCTDILSPSYDFLSTMDDGSCTYPVIGCTDPEADNFNPLYTEDDGSCNIGGCMDTTASNYKPTANFDNGACVFDDCVYGCTEPTASNYKPTATCDDGSCYGGCCGRNLQGNYVITGYTKSKINDIKWPGKAYNAVCADPAPNGTICIDEVSCIDPLQCNSTWGYDNIAVATTDPTITAKYGVNPYYPLQMKVPSLGMTNGWTQITEGQVTAYTINNIFYWDYAIGSDQGVGKGGASKGPLTFTKFALGMKNCCPGCLYPDIKEEWLMGHVFPPQIENKVFIDRGIASVFEEHYRITEVKRLEDFSFYQGGYFNLIN